MHKAPKITNGHIIRKSVMVDNSSILFPHTQQDKHISMLGETVRHINVLYLKRHEVHLMQ